MIDTQLEEALAETNRKRAELLKQQAEQRQQKMNLEIAELAEAGKRKRQEEEKDRLAMEELVRRTKAREIAKKKEEEDQAEAQKKNAGERRAAAAKEEAARAERKAKQETLEREQRENRRREEEIRRTAHELLHPRVVLPEPKPATLADGPLAKIVFGAEEKTECIAPIGTIETAAARHAEDVKIEAYRESIRDKSVPRNLTVNGADYSSLREGWRKAFAGEMISDQAAVHLLTLFYLHEIVRVLPEVVAMHKQRPMSMSGCAGTIESLLMK